MAARSLAGGAHRTPTTTTTGTSSPTTTTSATSTPTTTTTKTSTPTTTELVEPEGTAQCIDVFDDFFIGYEGVSKIPFSGEVGTVNAKIRCENDVDDFTELFRACGADPTGAAPLICMTPGKGRGVTAARILRMSDTLPEVLCLGAQAFCNLLAASFLQLCRRAFAKHLNVRRLAYTV